MDAESSMSYRMKESLSSIPHVFHLHHQILASSLVTFDLRHTQIDLLRRISMPWLTLCLIFALPSASQLPYTSQYKLDYS